MRLAWERRGVVRLTLKVEELADLIAGARAWADGQYRAGGADQAGEADRAGGQTVALQRILEDVDRAGAALAAASPAAPAWSATAASAASGEDWFHTASRGLQDRFGTRRLADRIAEKFVRDTLEGGDRAFVERADLFFIATADADGRPSCSYKGGDPGFVTVVDETTIAFPSYDGNGMFLSWGNVLANPQVGLLFIDLERGHRMRLNGTATIDVHDSLLAAYPGAQLIVRVAIREVFPNCPRYIHRYQLIERSTFVPAAHRVTPEPDWKREAWAVDVLPGCVTEATDPMERRPR